MDIHRVLDETPALISRKAEEAEILREAWKEAIVQYDHTEAGFVLSLKLRQEVKATEIKYYVNNDKGLYDFRLLLTRAEANYRKKEAEIKGLEEEINSAKMSARMMIAEMSNLGFNASNQKEA